MDCDLAAVFRGFISHFRDDVFKNVESYIKMAVSGESAVYSPIILQFSIDYNKWTEDIESKLILDAILNEPFQSQKSIQTAAWFMIYSILCEQYPQHRLVPQLEQIHCVLRFFHLPMKTEIQFTPFRDPVRLSLSTMKCVLNGLSEHCTLVRQSVWYCPKQCVNNQNVIIDGESNGAHKCMECNDKLHEYEVRVIFLTL